MDSPDNNEDFAGRLLHQGKFDFSRSSAEKLKLFLLIM
jgi:hypothetical protein